MKPKISIIIPIHNAGIFLRPCLESIIQQTLSEIEIILIIDCPTDGSDAIAQEYSLKYPYIKTIYNTQNQHIGFSRNKGIEIAQGEYIGFSDHDDFIAPYMFEKLYNIAKKTSATVIVCKSHSVTDTQYLPTNNRAIQTDNYISDTNFTDQCFLDLIANRQKIPTGLVFTHIYHRQFIIDNSIKFCNTKKISSEDQLFNIEVYRHLIAQCKTMVYLPEVLYYHRSHSSNTGNTIYYRELSKNIYFLEAILEQIHRCTKFPKQQLETLFEERVIKNLYTSWRYELKYQKLQAFKHLQTIPPSLKKIIQDHYKFYNPQLSICKNLFALFLRIYTHF